MGPAGLGLFSDLSDMESLADTGVLFLLFEQGLELTVDRLKSLSKYAFGMGSLQVLLTTAAFFTFPFIGGVQFLEVIMRSRPEVVDITRVDEALVIGAALSLSSSAFVLKILQEKNQLTTKFGAASLGILLFQDIAVVPLLVLLPIIENSSGPMPLTEQLTVLGATFVKAILGLGGILVVGGQVVRFLFSLVAKTRSSETFVALVLVVALGTGALTDSIGLSSTLGAFTAGTLLAESNYRTQIESDIKPFRGLLLGLFFLTTGASVDPTVIKEQWTTVLALLSGLIAFKTVITTALGPLFGLSKSESIRTGLLLSGGGEFAFVVLTLADKLNVLPSQLAKILVGVVVLSMAMTPYLSILGDKAAEFLEAQDRKLAVEGVEGMLQQNSEVEGSESGHKEFSDSDVVVICGFGPVGETVADFLSMPSVLEKIKTTREVKYVAFDLDPDLVVTGFRNGKRILYGDGSQPLVLETAGIESPRAFVVTYYDTETCFKSVERLRQAYPDVPIFARASSAAGYFQLREAGATRAVPDEVEASLRMTYSVLGELGISGSDADNFIEISRQDSDLKMETQLLEIEARKSGVYSLESSNRIVSSDATNFKSFKYMMEDFSAQIKDIIDSPRSVASDEELSEPQLRKRGRGTEYSKQMQNVDDSNLSTDLVDGVDICLLPERSTSSRSNAKQDINKSL